jgi:ADP-dependent NAD(P)H-hydrate dehydratase / NAD(P)H-hydrate epimerase
MKIVTVEQMIDLEQRSADVGAPPDFLMENAGLAVASSAQDMLGDVAGRSVVILVGPGNNGGDGLVAARHLHDWGAKVHLFLMKRKTDNDRNFSLDMERGIPWTDVFDDRELATFDKKIATADMFIDSLFGTGRVRPFEGVLKELLELAGAEKASCPDLEILAVDLPSGLDADTGEIDSATLAADMTVTLGYPKVGLFQFPGAAHVGHLEVVDIKIPEYLAEGIKTELITGDTVSDLLPSRPIDANKGSFGKLLVVAGSINYIGAACLACQAATRIGTGLVTLAIPKSLLPIVATKLTEVTYIPLSEDKSGAINAEEAVSSIQDQMAGYDAMLVGCGLGQNPETVELVRGLVSGGISNMPLIIDADGLNILAQNQRWWETIESKVVLTPHPGEMSRLAGKPVAEIQNDRLQTALNAAFEWNQIVVLKGAHTVVASPEGEARICGVANPGLATAGTGDVLAGAIAGLVAQGLSLFDAATCGVFIQALSSELVKAEIGDTGMIASDLLIGLPLVIKELKESW